MVDGNPTAALADFEAALELSPDDADLQLLRAGALRATGRAEDAIAAAALYIDAHPENVEARLIYARSLADINEVDPAIKAYSEAIALSPNPSPDLFTEQARIAAASGDEGTRNAIRILDGGIARLGPLVSLLSLAFDYESSLGDTDAALARLETLLALPGRHEQWQFYKAMTLEKKGLTADAAAAYHQLNDSLDALPERMKGTSYHTEFKERAARGIERTEAGAAP